MAAQLHPFQGSASGPGHACVALISLFGSFNPPEPPNPPCSSCLLDQFLPPSLPFPPPSPPPKPRARRRHSFSSRFPPLLPRNNLNHSHCHSFQPRLPPFSLFLPPPNPLVPELRPRPIRPILCVLVCFVVRCSPRPFISEQSWFFTSTTTILSFHTLALFCIRPVQRLCNP